MDAATTMLLAGIGYRAVDVGFDDAEAEKRRATTMATAVDVERATVVCFGGQARGQRRCSAHEDDECHQRFASFRQDSRRLAYGAPLVAKSRAGQINAQAPNRGVFFMEMPNPPGSANQTLGRYLLHEEIVSGGMGVVHFGSVREDGRTRVVAIKQLNPSLVSDPEVEQAFLREAGLAVRIRHENVVSTLEVGVHCGELFVVMEYIHGESLARLMKAGRAPAPPRIASRIAIDVLDGLAAVHDARDDEGRPLGVVHRDVSPQNVLVAADGTSFIIDFGIAKLAGEATHTRPGLVKGKLSYMSPEQLKAEEVTPATDLFAAAVVLWEMLTGTRLFASGSVGSVMRRIAEGRIEPPSAHAPGIPSSLDALVLQGLRPDPADRFTSALSFAEQLAESVPPASRAEVADWVLQRAGPVLDQRAKIVRRIEQGGSPKHQPPKLERRRRDQRINVPALLAVAAAASALGILAGIAFFATRVAPEKITSTPATEVVVGTTRSLQAPSAASSTVVPCASTVPGTPGDESMR